MDSFMNLAKQGYAAYESSQENVSKTGGSEYNRPSQSQHDSGNGGVPHVDEDYAVSHAAQHGSGDSSLFSSAMGFLNSNPGAKHEPIDEQHVTNAHQQAYEQGPSSNMSADSLGSAAAMQAFKLFTSGQSQRSGGGGNDSSHLVGLAMSEASKLFDKAGGSSSGGKQEVINSAAMMVMKMLVQSKVSGMMGGSNSGGLSSLMGMASKFM